MPKSVTHNNKGSGNQKNCSYITITLQYFFEVIRIIQLLASRSRRPGTGPQNGNSRKVLAGVLAQVLAKMGVLAGVLAQVLAQVLAGRALWENRDKTTCQHLCQHSGQHPHCCQHLCQHPRQHFSEIPILGSVPLPTIQSETWLVHAKVREPHLNLPVHMNFLPLALV